jgi:Ca-activated chloride channel family protein
MPGIQAMKVPAQTRAAKLVSVDGRAYPLQSARIAAEASGGIAFSTLVQTYRNPYAEPLEVIYTLPLPADGAVIGFSMKLGERIIRGEVRARDEAIATYKKALFEGRSAALLEQDRDDTFTQRLGSLPAGQSAEITIEVLHPLAFLPGVSEQGAEWEYRFPTVVGVRYEGAAGRVPDADRLELDRSDAGGSAIPTRIELALTTIGDDGKAVRRIDAMPLDRDLVVRFRAGATSIGAHLVEGPGLPGDMGRYGILTITPPRVSEVAFARDLTILIDASGSMSGMPLAWAKDVAAGLLPTLRDGDRFEVIAFSDQPRSLTGGIVPVTDGAMGAVLDELSRLKANGGTEMVDAMVRALWPLRPDSQHQVVLITDGEIGFEDEVVGRIVSSLPDGARLHTVGVGSAPNRTLTCRAARAGCGVESFVCGDAEVQPAIARLIAATARPVLTDLAIASSASRGIAPARPRDVLAGQPLVVAMELDPAGGILEATGRLAGTTERWRWHLTVPPIAARERAVTAMPLGALYGREAIADCELSPGRTDAKVKTIALRHRIASRMTSLVAVAEEPNIDPKAPRRRVVVPVELPAFVSAEGVGLKMRGRLDVRALDEAFSYTDDEGFLARSLGRLEQDEVSAFRKRPRLSVGRPAASRTRARVLSVTGYAIVIELETPSDGFLRPDGKVRLFNVDDLLGLGGVDPIGSSPIGPHAKGLILRIVIIGFDNWRYAVGDEITIEEAKTA